LFFDAHVGVEVDLGGLGVLVAEPEGDNRGVDAGFQTGRERFTNHAEYLW
jgi:hypothetical protein